MVVPKNRKPWKLVVLGLGWYMEHMYMLRVLVPGRFHEKLPVQTRLAADGKTGGRKKLELPPLTSPANPEEHVFIPLDNYGVKIQGLFQGQEFVFLRGGVGVGRTTLGYHLGREYPKTFISVLFGDGGYDSWRKNIVEGIKLSTGKEVNESGTQLEDALRLAKADNLTLVLDEAHTIFNLPRIRTLLFKSSIHPKVLLLSASGEGNAGSPTTPTEISQKVFWTPPIPGVGEDFVERLTKAGVCLDKDSVDFFMKFCGGHRSIFIAAMAWVKNNQHGALWKYNETVTRVRDSIDATDWWARGSILEGLAASRGVKVNGQFGNLDMVPMEFVNILCEGPGQLSEELRRDLTVCGFVIPVPIEHDGEFRQVEWTRDDVVYMVANPILASFYRNRLERFRGLKVRIDPFLPVNCMDLLLRAIPYVTFAQVVGFSPKAAADSSLSKDDLPFEDQYNAAIIEVLQRLGYAADSSHNKEVGKVDIFVNIDNRTFGVECIMAKRGPTDHENHRGRFDTALYAYSNADHKALVTIGSSKSRAQERVLKTKADGVEIIGLVPNIAHTGYNILYRGLGAKQLSDSAFV